MLRRTIIQCRTRTLDIGPVPLHLQLYQGIAVSRSLPHFQLYAGIAITLSNLP
mgnify:CR=1 FL=1